MSVTQIQWYAENDRFAVGFADGVLSMCSKEQFEPPVSVEAHEVIICQTGLINIRQRLDQWPASAAWCLVLH